MKAPELFPPDAAQSAIDPETQKQLAGLASPTAQPLVPEAFALAEQGSDVTEPSEHLATGASTGTPKPLPKTLFTLVATGTGLGVVAGLAFGVFPRTVAQKPSQAPESDKAPPQIVPDDAAALRSQLAFQDQKKVVAAARPEPPQSIPVAAGKATATKPASAPVPAPAAIAPPLPARTATPVAPRTEPPVDPLARWSALAALGKAEATVDQPTAAAATVATNPTTPSPFPSVQLGTSVPTLVADQSPEAMPPGAAPTSLESTANDLTPGTLGILKHAGIAAPELLLGDRSLTAPTISVATAPEPALNALVPVPLGTTTPASVTIPLVWDTSSGKDDKTQTPKGRFQVELTEDMHTSDGAVALPQGTQLMMQATTVSPDNQLVSASAIAVLYRGRDGGFRQEVVPPGAILLQGKQGAPLVARKLNDPGAALAKQDLLVGGLSALGQAGALLNQPTEEFSNAINSDSFSSTTIRRSRQPNLLPALLDGFFNTTAQRLNQRSEQATQELIRRNTVAVLPAGTEVSVVINSFFRVNR
ncbi:MAG: hypothetical protein KME45_32935 [Stenomitos rutilans HA7619-LM2]|jgi:hypothetical protein|nr:hypothetical protein [Stenomitos rutilans HA7619-LM2]